MFLTAAAEFHEIAILCVVCHESIERLPHEEMEKRVKAIIEAR